MKAHDNGRDNVTIAYFGQGMLVSYTVLCNYAPHPHPHSPPHPVLRIFKKKKKKSGEGGGRVQELCESRGGRPGLSVLTSLLVSVDVKLY